MKRRLIALGTILIAVLLTASQCPDLDPDPYTSDSDIVIEFVTYETRELGPYPRHQAGENERFVVLDMVISNHHLWKEFSVHRMYFYLRTSDQRFVASSGASGMADLTYPIANNSEILSGGSARNMTFFRVPLHVTDYEFEYDAGWSGGFQNDDIQWVQVSGHE